MSDDDWLFHRCLKLIPEGLYQDPKSGNPLLFPLSDSPVNVGRSRTAERAHRTGTSNLRSTIGTFGRFS